MINNVNAGISMPPPPPRTQQNLTEEQQTFVTDTLAEFDADELSEEDALSIIDMFSQADIQPGAALEKVMSSAGFDAKSIGDIAAAADSSRPPPPPPKQSSDEISSMADYLAELLEETLAASQSESLSDEDKQAILAQVFDKFNIEPSESIINTTA
ncbi:hypothetical protein [Cognaticolwellia aestuarii]|uniref:hypothetical protein n=1 Tax=Cognaticolwellia aestuarii TaxID=329993 RepID=UPI0009862F8C|nr:hypothetical protein [Cognaticolwellia aestuarii]